MIAASVVSTIATANTAIVTTVTTIITTISPTARWLKQHFRASRPLPS